MKNCVLCERNFREDLVLYETDSWLIRHSEETNILGYCILQSKRHILDLSEGHVGELASYGALLSSLMIATREVTGCERVYTFSLGEAVPHYHLHVVPRSSTFPRSYRGRGITSYPTEPGPSLELARETAQRIARRIGIHIRSQLKITGP